MPDNGNKTHPVRTLTVRNFSVIKEAKLEFGKITVLIGPQASGKSLLCKLAYFFQKVVREQLAEALKIGDAIGGAKMKGEIAFSKWFPNTGIDPGEILLEYRDGEYVVRVEGLRRKDGFQYYALRLSNGIVQSYESVLESVRQQMAPSGGNIDPVYYLAIFDELDRLCSSSNSDVYSFIPSTRAFFVTQQKAVLGASSGNDPLTIRFSQDFDFSFPERAPKAGLEHDLTRWIDAESRRILQGEVLVRDNSEIFLASDNRKLSLRVLSSGTQELLPLITCIRQFIAYSAFASERPEVLATLRRRLFFVEEPEASIFPFAQNDLVRIFARMSHEPLLDASWVITTHSPYILSAFNNLIEASQVVTAKPELKDEVA